MIPDKFRKDDNIESNAYTVGELKELLEELPDDLKIIQGFKDGCRVAVASVGIEHYILYFDEINEGNYDNEEND